MWLCEDKLKGKTAHFRLPSASQKRACLSSLLANQERSFWKINQSYCQKVKDNACFFFGSCSWSRSEVNTFFGVEYCGKKQIECGSALSVLLSTMIFVIAVVKICYGLTQLRLLSPYEGRLHDAYRVMKKQLL